MDAKTILFVDSGIDQALELLASSIAADGRLPDALFGIPLTNLRSVGQAEVAASSLGSASAAMASVALANGDSRSMIEIQQDLILSLFDTQQ